MFLVRVAGLVAPPSVVIARARSTRGNLGPRSRRVVLPRFLAALGMTLRAAGDRASSCAVVSVPRTTSCPGAGSSRAWVRRAIGKLSAKGSKMNERDRGDVPWLLEMTWNAGSRNRGGVSREDWEGLCAGVHLCLHYVWGACPLEQCKGPDVNLYTEGGSPNRCTQSWTLLYVTGCVSSSVRSQRLVADFTRLSSPSGHEAKPYPWRLQSPRCRHSRNEKRRLTGTFEEIATNSHILVSSIGRETRR
jgi:hypothetical protein